MFKTLQNTVSLDFTLVPDGPILVRAQSSGIDPGVADMEFQRTVRDGRRTVFLAGSGLKGVLRSHCERLLRSSELFACDPTKTKWPTESCGRQDDKASLDPKKYRHHRQCPACFTFGSLKLAGRFRVGDAYPLAESEAAANRTEVRAGVGINRQSQAAQTGVLYDTEVVVGGGFQVRLQGENFSLWQLGLVLAALQDLDAGLVRIGGGKARGMGSVRLSALALEMRFFNRKTGWLTGVVPEPGDAGKYGLPPQDELRLPEGLDDLAVGLCRTVAYRDEGLTGTLPQTLIEGPLQAYLRGAER